MAPRLLTQELSAKVFSFVHKVNPTPQIQPEDLRLLELPYFGFDDREHQGQMIVHHLVAEEVIEIFHDLFDARYPIEKMRLIEEYDANDEHSMEDNNSSAFCYRLAVAKSTLSHHSFGRAIDVNPFYNPYVKNQLILPKSAARYADRSTYVKGMILPGDVCHTAFTSKGWVWGGSWPDRQDYQHFEKPLS